MTRQEFDNYKFGVKTKVVFLYWFTRKEDEDFLSEVDFGDRTVFTRRTNVTLGYRAIRKIFEVK